MKRILLLIFCFSALILFAQPSIDNFTYLESSGELPADFKKFLNPSKKDISGYYIKEQFISGNIVYGSVLNDYINHIADLLLQDYPKLKQQIRFYINKSTNVNAYCTENGIIFINLGLLAQVSNESELAFIMAHEIVHFAEHHIYKLDEYKTKNKSDDIKDLYLKYHHRSREHEMEADKLALERYFKNSPYSFSVLDGVFDVLQYDYLPFDEIPFLRTYVEMDFYKFPDNYYLTNLNPIRSREDYIDTLSTHPNILKRRENVKQMILGYSNEGRKVFVQSEALFYEIRELARFECINTFLTNHEYDDAIYNIYILQKNHPENQFLEIAMAGAIYGLSKHKTYGGLGEIIENYKKIEGEKQQVNFLFSKLNKNELNLLALRFLWKTYTQYPQNDYLNLALKDILSDLTGKNKLGYSDFSDYAMGTNPDSISEETVSVDTTTKALGKYDRIKQQSLSKSNRVLPNDKFKTFNYMLVDMKMSPEFVSLFNDALKYNEDKKINNLISDKKKLTVISKSIVTKPLYSRYYRIKNAGKRSGTSEKYQKERGKLEKTIEYCLKANSIEHVFYSDNFLDKINTEEYNHFCRIESCKKEFINSEFNSMILHQSQNISMVMDELEATTINIVATYTKAGEIGKGKLMSLLLTPICIAATPAIFAHAFLPVYYTNVKFVVFNPVSGEILMDESFYKTSEMPESYINSFLYQKYYQIKKGNMQ